MNWYFFWLLEFVTWLLSVIFNGLWLERVLRRLWSKHTLRLGWKHRANTVFDCQAEWLKKASCDEAVRGDFMLTSKPANKCYHQQAESVDENAVAGVCVHLSYAENAHVWQYIAPWRASANAPTWWRRSWTFSGVMHVFSDHWKSFLASM